MKAKNVFFSHSIGLFKILTLWNKSNWQQRVCYYNISSCFASLASHSNLHKKMDLCACPIISAANSWNYFHRNCRNQWWQGKSFAHDNQFLRGVESRILTSNNFLTFHLIRCCRNTVRIIKFFCRIPSADKKSSS